MPSPFETFSCSALLHLENPSRSARSCQNRGDFFPNSQSFLTASPASQSSKMAGTQCKNFFSVLQYPSALTPPVNPFAKRESHSVQAVWTYKILTILSWLLVVVTSINYTFAHPHDDVKHWRNTIWGHNKHYATPFALNALMASLYWYVSLQPRRLVARNGVQHTGRNAMATPHENPLANIPGSLSSSPNSHTSGTSSPRMATTSKLRPVSEATSSSTISCSSPG